ncbi:glycosyltransferase [Rhodobacter calidifons]|uniref:Glycosyltransferase n=1 Tax=Rhodobacter calidifons TaxID=2715277 RepID=A0ABX0G293_9RHOB|nr:glycosyltransferase [Rhodobacter calidifons]NHB75231.1 glycosyltransferase [Rhodobacter calidifons]
MRLSLVVMAYRQEAFIAETVAAALAQDHPDLEIVLSDDASPDATFRIMSDMAAAYAGPHRIVLNRNPQNLGLIGHVNRLFDLVTSDWLIYNAGDDISEPHRARVIAEAIARDDPRYVYSNVTDLDASGAALARQRTRTRPAALQQKSLPELAKAVSHALGASSAWHRVLFDRFGPITETEVFEDQVLMFRARLLGSVTYLDDRLLRYRRSIGLSFQSKEDQVRKLRQDLAIMRQRRADVLRHCPDRRDILKAIARKEERRQRALDDVLAGRQIEDPEGEDA